MLAFIKRKKFLLIGVTAVVAVFAVGATLRGNGNVETRSPALADLVRSVKISGKVTPRENVDLSFETTGAVSGIVKNVGDTVRRGDVLVRIDSSTISADIQKAEAELALAVAGLEKLEGASGFEAQIANSKQSIVQTMKNAYSSAEDAVYSKTDQFFINPDSNKPEMKASFAGYSDLKNSISAGRVEMDTVLISWKTLVNNLTVSNYSDQKLSEAKGYLEKVSTYIASVARATTLFEESSAVSKSDIENYRSDANTARTSVNTASSNLISAEDTLKNLLLDVPAQVARVESARASLNNFRSQLRKTSLTSPIDGVVSRQDAKVGQVVSASTNVVSVISPNLEIEAFIPEVLIAGIALNNPANVTLDAYGRETIFEAVVIHIDPAETIKDGVSTYKIRLAFNANDARIRSGMTANVEIETFRKPSVTLIPERTVVRNDEGTFVYLYTGNKEGVRTPVEIGERDSSGNVELLTTLEADSLLIMNPS